MEPFDPHEDRCGCSKEPGTYGQNGWHWYRPTHEQLIIREMHYLAKDDDAMKQALLADLWRKATPRQLAYLEEQRALVVAHKGEMLRGYVGIPVALERCPAYKRQAEEAIRQAQREARREAGEREMV